MNRRQFLLSSPAALLGSALPLFTPETESAESTLGPEEQERLMKEAEYHYQQLFFIVPRWYRHPDAQQQAQALLECLAEVWCRKRGMPPSPGRTHWHLLAKRRPDDFTGVPWRAADEAVQRLDEYANRLVPWKQKAMLAEGDVNYSHIEPSTRAVLRAFEAATGCMNAVDQSLDRVNAYNTSEERMSARRRLAKDIAESLTA